MDKFQKRYLAHQKKKQDILLNKFKYNKNQYSEQEMQGLQKMFRNRKSVRLFKSKLEDKDIFNIIEIALSAPSSCNRHGVSLRKAPKKLIPLLIGGKGWCDKGTVLAFYADMKCYKSPYEKDFMPYLDTGFMAQNIYLYCESVGVGCCFINPNTHDKYKSEQLLTGAIVIGQYD